MKFRYYLFMFLFSNSIHIYCQNVTVDSMVINHIIEKEPVNYIVEGFGEGPNIEGVLIIKNDVNTPIAVGNYLYLKYYFEDYVCSSLPFYYTPDNKMTILPNDTLSIQFRIPLLLGSIRSNLIKSEADSGRVFNSSIYIMEIANSVSVCIMLDGKMIDTYPKKVIIDDDIYYIE